MHIDDGIQFPVLTPNILIHGQLITYQQNNLTMMAMQLRSDNDISNVVRTQPGIDGIKNTCVPLEKNTI